MVTYCNLYDKQMVAFYIINSFVCLGFVFACFFCFIFVVVLS